MDTFSVLEVQDALRPYGVALNDVAAEKILAYIAILRHWNKSISLTTVTDPGEILKFHFGESIFAAGELNYEKSRLADVGSGAGFPGLPLAIVSPGLDVTLIESNTRKCAFLSEVARELRLDSVTVFRGRMEDYPSEPRPLNFVTARAIGNHARLLAWARNHVAPGGRILLWLGETDSRGVSADAHWSWGPTKRIPGSDRRYLLVGAPKE
jgi:16S rRNA (guanine527-N7)-methyltransferase